MANVLSVDYDSRKIYLHTGFSSTISNSFSSPSTAPYGLAWDGTNVYSGDFYSDKIYLHTGFSSTIANSFSSPSTGPGEVSWDGTNVLSGDFYSSKIYLHTGFSSTISNSFSSPSTVIGSLSWEGANVLSNDRAAVKIYLHTGFSSTISNSFSSPSSDGCYGLTWDGTNLLSSDYSEGKVFLHSGFSSTISNSFASALILSLEWDDRVIKPPVFRSYGQSPGVTSSANCVIVKPVGLAVGDLMIAQVVSRVGGTAVTAPDGSWTQIRQDASGADLRSALFWKIAVAADVAAADFTFTVGNSDSQMGAILAFYADSFNTITPIAANNGQANSASTTVTAPTVTLTTAYSAILLFAAIADNNTQSAYAIATSNPVEWSERYDLLTTQGSDCALSVGHATRAEKTATGNGTATTSGSDINIGQLVVVNQVAAGINRGRAYYPHILAH